MAEHVEPYEPAIEAFVGWDPNTPDAVLQCDDFARAALALRPHPDDTDQRCVVLRWDMVLLATMGPPNGEGLEHHRLYNKGLSGITWIGLVRQSDLVSELRPMWMSVASDLRMMPVHYVVLTKQCVVEVLAADEEVFRLAGETRTAVAECFAL